MTAPSSPVRALAEELLDAGFTIDPFDASLVGLPGYDDRLPDHTEAGEAASVARADDIATRAAAIDPSTLDDEDTVTRAVVEKLARSSIDRLNAKSVEYTITGLFISPPSQLISAVPLLVHSDTAKARDFLSRLRAIPEYLTTVADRNRAGVAAGRLPVERLINASIAFIDRYLAAPDTDPFMRQPFPEGAADLTAERARLVADVVRPAFAQYRAFLADEMLAHGRPDERPGLCWLPGGDAIYAGLARAHTTTDRTPEELHQTGLDIMARLREEYAEIGSRVFGSTDQQEIFRRMTSDPELRWNDADELLAAAVRAVERAGDVAPQWFGRLPSQPCKIESVPEAEAPSAPTAYYMIPSMDGSRPGIYFANTYQAEERNRFTSEVIAYHEAIPGHHFQLSLAQELTHLPLLRRGFPINAYAEGWGLYTERLADEMGLYSGDVDRLGLLAMDSLRAGRLVVDTGLHAKGWSRQQAIDYLRENSPVSDLEIASETDRYIAYAGQALSYMVGRLEIQRIRAEAEQRLGSSFDIRAFHDVVLGGGSLPLGVLDDVVTRWVDGQLSSV
jgi:uncharacterized protein (DUF885 family)